MDKFATWMYGKNDSVTFTPFLAQGGRLVAVQAYERQSTTPA